MDKPNIFSYATSELSQDAFICWLLDWAKPDRKSLDAQLHSCGVRFVQALFAKHGISYPPTIVNFNIKQQWMNIDLLCEINEYILLIEDKTYTENHSGQLERYVQQLVSLNIPIDNIIRIYLKTIDQSNFKAIRSAGYMEFTRPEFLDLLEQYKGTDSILVDFRRHLQSISNKVEAYRTVPTNCEWTSDAWMGFFMHLQQHLNQDETEVGDWGYVNNPRGGFMGYSWHWVGDDDCQQYLQLEHEKLCLKIWVNHKNDRARLRQKWYQKSIDQCLAFQLELSKPSFGNGQYMTVAIYRGDYRVTDESGCIDVDATIGLLKRAESLLDQICEGRHYPES